MAMTETAKKRPYAAPVLNSVSTSKPSVMLACSDPVASFDCDAAFGLGYKCCMPDEPSCSNC
jgi:hypothetical protein